MHAITVPADGDAPAAARAAWRRRIAWIGSEIQLAFAALWFARGTLATGWPARLPIGIALAAAAVAVGIWGAAATQGRAGNTLTATAGLATAAILTTSAITGFGALASGTLGTPDPAPVPAGPAPTPRRAS